MERCSGCNVEVRHYFMCDEEPGDKQWCPKCFGDRPCRVEPHGEGCETGIWDDDES